MNIIIAGGRDFNNYELLKERCLAIIDSFIFKDDIKIVCGKARGADTIGENFAKEFNYQILEYPADWHKYGRSAGYIRNEEMAKVSQVLIAFWDGKSKGTKHMINLAKKYNLEIHIINY